MSEYEPDFIERNGTWLLSLVGIVVTCFSGMLAYFLKSRCQTIKCWGMECQRDVLNLENVSEGALQIELSKRQSPDIPVTANVISKALSVPRRPRPRHSADVESATTNSENVDRT